MTVDVARHQWEEGLRRLGAERGARARQLAELVDAVQDELRRRIGQTFSLAELAGAYGGSEDWVRDVVVEHAPPRSPVGVRDTALVQDAAFGNYARGATDYRP
jgi:hypothetical protein